MTKLGFKIALLLFVAPLVSTASMPTYAAGPRSLIESKVIQRDTRGRIKLMETRTRDGVCKARVAYDKKGSAWVYLAVFYRASQFWQNLDYRQINVGTDGLDNKAVIRDLNMIMSERCLPLVVKGYHLI